MAEKYKFVDRRRDGAPRRLQNVDSINTPDELNRFAYEQTGSVNSALLENDLAEVNDDGEFVVNKGNVKKEARKYVDYTQRFPEYPRDYINDLRREEAAAAGRPLTRQGAERQINREEAAKARAILLAARVGKVELTEAQRQRLERVDRGEFLDMVYGQYKSGDRGTIEGPKKKDNYRRASNYATEAAREEARMHFITNVMYSGRHSRRKAS